MLLLLLVLLLLLPPLLRFGGDGSTRSVNASPPKHKKTTPAVPIRRTLLISCFCLARFMQGEGCEFEPAEGEAFDVEGAIPLEVTETKSV